MYRDRHQTKQHNDEVESMCAYLHLIRRLSDVKKVAPYNGTGLSDSDLYVYGGPEVPEPIMMDASCQKPKPFLIIMKIRIKYFPKR